MYTLQLRVRLCFLVTTINDSKFPRMPIEMITASDQKRILSPSCHSGSGVAPGARMAAASSGATVAVSGMVAAFPRMAVELSVMFVVLSRMKLAYAILESLVFTLTSRQEMGVC